MTAPIRLPKVDPSLALNAVIDDAHSRIVAKGGTPTEPEFVHELISRRSVRYLNIEASKLYDPAKNSVKFFSGFIHNNPLVHFDADDKSGNKKADCSVEIGDMLLVKVLTQPNKSGKHTVIARRALLIQAKKSKAREPSLIRKLIGKKGFLDIKDREQLFLYNKWPEFTLKAGGTPLGTFDLSAMGSAVGFPIGKYGAVVDPKAKSPFKSGACWNALDPIPGAKGSKTLGKLLSDFIDDDPFSGKDYAPVVPGKTPTKGWDALIGELTKYCKIKSYSSFGRLRDPSGSSFMTVMSDWITAQSTLMQHGSEVFDDLLNFFPEVLLPDPISQYPDKSSPGEESIKGMPVLIVGVSSFSPPEAEFDPLTPESKLNLVLDAFETMRQVQRTRYE